MKTFEFRPSIVTTFKDTTPIIKTDNTEVEFKKGDPAVLVRASINGKLVRTIDAKNFVAVEQFDLGADQLAAINSQAKLANQDATQRTMPYHRPVISSPRV